MIQVIKVEDLTEELLQELLDKEERFSVTTSSDEGPLFPWDIIKSEQD